MKIKSNKDLRDYVRFTTNNGHEVQSEIDLQLVDARLKDARIRYQPNPLHKNIFRSQNPLEVFFKKDLNLTKSSHWQCARVDP